MWRGGAIHLERASVWGKLRFSAEHCRYYHCCCCAQTPQRHFIAVYIPDIDAAATLLLAVVMLVVPRSSISRAATILDVPYVCVHMIHIPLPAPIARPHVVMGAG